MTEGGWGDGWKRLGEANRREHVKRLRRMTTEESIREFEVHSRVLTGLETYPPRRRRAAGLGSIWSER